MKYRCLTDGELKELEPEFKRFLITNDISSEEWESLNKNNDKKVMQLVELFSDIVMEKALKNIRYLKHTMSKGIQFFYFGSENIELIGIGSEHEVDFLAEDFDPNQKGLEIFHTTKGYRKKREEEVFEMLEMGCSITDEKSFTNAKLAFQYSTKQAKN